MRISKDTLFSCCFPRSIQKNIMSCGNQCGDIEDIADNLFEFDDEARDKVPKQRKLKKVHKKKEKEVKDEGQGEADQVDFPVAENAINQVPGTQSIYVKTFGCSHNISDSEFMIGQLVEYGYNIVDTPDKSDLILVNSCTVKNPSQDAFMTMVATAKRIKKPLVVAGCVPQGDRTIQEIAEISTLGVTQIDRVVQVVQETLKGNKMQLLETKGLPSLNLPKIRKNKEIEIIPINTGCLGACTYCKTVFARGRLGSYTPEAITNRVRSVIAEGVREIWLTSQDTGAYGRDIGTNISELLVSLCAELNNHPHIMMRFGMTNPPYMLDHLPTIAKFLNHPRVFSFIHIPVQSGSDAVLERMNRQYTVADFEKVCDYLIKHVPGLTVATDIICGFPGETNEQFEETIELVKKYKFSVVNISQFYPRPGTAAAKMDKVPTHIVKERSSKITKVFLSFDKFSHLVGQTFRVWVNEKEENKGVLMLVGHTKNYVKISIPFDAELLHTQIMVKVTKAFDWHVEGDIIEKNVKVSEVPAGYVEDMKLNLVKEAEYLKVKKQNKIKELKLKRNNDSKEESKDSSSVATEEKKTDLNEKTKTLEEKQNLLKDIPLFKPQVPSAESIPKTNYALLWLSIALFAVGIILHQMGI